MNCQARRKVSPMSAGAAVGRRRAWGTGSDNMAPCLPSASPYPAGRGAAPCCSCSISCSRWWGIWSATPRASIRTASRLLSATCGAQQALKYIWNRQSWQEMWPYNSRRLAHTCVDAERLRVRCDRTALQSWHSRAASAAGTELTRASYVWGVPHQRKCRMPAVRHSSPPCSTA